jgi:hydrogenase/urease accessory protein HupE
MNTFRIILYLLAIATSFACTVLLFRAYAQRGLRLLLWSSLCFVGLSISNILLFLDLVIFPMTELRPARLISALVGLLFLLYGFIWESE